MSWPTARIGDVCKVVSGATPKTTNPSYWDGDVPWVTPKDLSELNSKVLLDTPRKITKAGLNSCSARMLPAESVLFSSRAPIGLVAINAFPVCTNQGFKSMVPRGDRIFSGYLFWWLTVHRDHLQNLGRGATFKEVSKQIVEEIEIPLPPLAEQKRIAAILDAADALQAKRRESLAELDSLLRSTFLELFGDPATNPRGFPVRVLSDFYISESDGTKCGPFGSALKKNELVRTGVPVWSMDNIGPAGRMVPPFRMWITEDKCRDLKAYSVIDGDVVISRAGTVGKMCVADSAGGPSIISTNLIRARFGPNLSPIYFVSLMTYCKGRVGRLKTGPDGAFTHMSTGVLDKLRFPYPPLDLQRRFATIVESIERQKTCLRVHLAELDTLFASLQSRAFNGQL
ncbi:MAG: restriction endonuclease subunit S [Chromatiaceae bacterium]|nr:restriction endonuclease subunit S [Chromatiaceae bacterium]MCF8015611.1 restriction endonuclease subunit S [Chromatiaceae bacterium]